jgi:hypothetical protein
MKKLLIGSVAAIAIVAGSAVVANAADLGITNVDFTGGRSDLSGTINGSAYSNNSVYTGLIVLTTTGGNTVPVFCIDLFHTIGIHSYNPALPYTTGTIVADSSTGLAGTGGNPLNPPVPGEIQALANLGYQDYVHGTGSNDIYAALQGAIWYIEYNQNGNNLSVEGGATIDALIAGDIAYASAHPAAYSIALFPGANGQAFDSAGQGFSPGVPEPASWLMMLAGFAGLGFLGYRRNKASTLAD